MLDRADAYRAGIEAVDDILADVFRVPVSKALDPLDQKDFVRLADRLARELRRTSRPIVQETLERAVARLDVNWPVLAAADRSRIIRAAAQMFVEQQQRINPITQLILRARSETFAKQSKTSAIRRNRLRIARDLVPQDERIARFVAESQSNFVRDEFGRRRKLFSARARRIVSDGVAQGLGRDTIVRDLQREVRSSVFARDRAYWSIVSTVFANRARTFAQMSAFSQAGVDEYRFEAVLDEVTSNICRFLDGRRFSVPKAMNRIRDVENLRDPEKIKALQPFVSDGVDADGNPAMVFKRGDRRRVVARVIESAVGVADARGKFSRGLTRSPIEAAGLQQPPLHGRCRSTVVAIT